MMHVHGAEHLAAERLVGGLVITAVVVIAYLVVEVVDRVTESPAMRSHVNDGSEKFFRERGTIWQAAIRAAAERLGAMRSWI